MAKKECAICSAALGMMSVKFPTCERDAVICKNCAADAGLGIKDTMLYSPVQIAERIQRKKSVDSDLNQFSLIGQLLVDAQTQRWAVKQKNGITAIHSYKDIQSFSLDEDGDTIVKGGIGTAVAGGILFGGAGAIVGFLAGRKNKQEVSSMKLNIVTASGNESIEFLQMKTKKGSILYKTASLLAEQTAQQLQAMVDFDG